MASGENSTILSMVGVMLGNPKLKCIVIDRSEGEPVNVDAYGAGWEEILTELMAGQRKGIDFLTRHLLDGGPVGAEEGDEERLLLDLDLNEEDAGETKEEE